jgi:hypothetical protein
MKTHAQGLKWIDGNGSDSDGSLAEFVVGDDETPIRATATQRNYTLDSFRATVDERAPATSPKSSKPQNQFSKPPNQFSKPPSQFSRPPSQFNKPLVQSQVTSLPRNTNQFSQNKNTTQPNTPIIKKEPPPNQFKQPNYPLIVKKEPFPNQFKQPYTTNIQKEQPLNQFKKPNTTNIKPPYQSNQPQIIKKESPPRKQFAKPKPPSQFMGAKPQTSGLSFQPPPLNKSQFGGKKIERIPAMKPKDQSGSGGVGVSTPWKK